MSMSSGSVVITLRAIDKASGTMGKVKASMSLLANQISQLGGGFQSVGNIMQGFAGAGVMGAVAVGLGEVIKVFQDSLIAFTDFETALVDVSSASGKTGDVLIQLEKDLQAAAKTAGVDFGVGATEAMKALESLVKAGLEGEAAIVALNAALALAKIETISTAEASDMLIGILGMFKLSAEQAAYATDVLVNASITGIGTASQFARGLAYVGGRAEALGFSLEETTAALVAMNNQGINATSAGQYLNMMFSQMISKSDQLGFSLYDASGKMLSLAEISGNLVTRLQEFSTEEEKNAYLTQIFGARAGIAANALMGLGDSGEEVTAVLAAMTEDLGKTGTALDIVDAKTDTLAGTQARLDAMMQNLQLTLGEALAPAALFFAEIMEDTLIPLFEDILPPIMDVIDVTMKLLKFWIDLGKVIAHYLQPIFNQMVTFLKPLIDAFMVVADVIAYLTNTIIGSVSSMALEIEGSTEEIADLTDDIEFEFVDMGDTILDTFDEIGDAAGGMADQVAAAYDEMVSEITDLINRGLVGEAQDAIEEFVNCSVDKQASMVEQITGYLTDLEGEYDKNVEAIFGLLAKGKREEAEMLKAANKDIAQKMEQLETWRSQIISGAMPEGLAGGGGGGGAPVIAATTHTYHSDITLTFTEPITVFDARTHAMAIEREIRMLRAEERRMRWMP